MKVNQILKNRSRYWFNELHPYPPFKNEGLTFTHLVDQVRCELAEHYIKQKNIPISEMAFLLGYSEVSALSRAFKRWFGVTPRQLRH